MRKFEFIVTEKHIKLLENSWVSWNTMVFGSPTVDPKRPYGSKTVYQDMADIFGEEIAEDCYKHPEYDKIHQEMETVLQILLYNCREGIRPGKYVKEDYGREWKFSETT